MGLPSFPPSGRVLSLIESLPFIGLGVAIDYESSDTPKGEEITHTGGYRRRVSVHNKLKTDSTFPWRRTDRSELHGDTSFPGYVRTSAVLWDQPLQVSHP